ncbi:279_t:CDS:10 [Ambispora gerdemannii]|uniref:279_t:CDS:1 n=1 Tax=Ambispora gerdemannii TaxID=144530 RepID=A0A9N9FJH1_9GLOM|nr:279_t:CDS:10 [Ambispora gerdemannii]
MSQLHYKFADKPEFEVLPFEGSDISIIAAKENIIKALDLKEADIVLSQADTGEEYTDNKLIPSNTRIIIKHAATKPVSGLDPPVSSLPLKSSGDPNTNTTKGFPKQQQQAEQITGVDIITSNPNIQSEDDAIKTMFQQQAIFWDAAQNKSIKTSPSEVPPERTNGSQSIASSSAIPKQYPRPSEVILRKKSIGQPSWNVQNGQANGFPTQEIPSFSSTTSVHPSIAQSQVFRERPNLSVSTSTESLQIPQELQCGICKRLVKEAESTPCCRAIYCRQSTSKASITSNEWVGRIQETLIRNGFKCPECRKQLMTGDLEEDTRTREAVRKYKEDGGVLPQTQNQSLQAQSARDQSDREGADVSMSDDSKQKADKTDIQNVQVSRVDNINTPVSPRTSKDSQTEGTSQDKPSGLLPKLPNNTTNLRPPIQGARLPDQLRQSQATKSQYPQYPQMPTDNFAWNSNGKSFGVDPRFQGYGQYEDDYYGDYSNAYGYNQNPDYWLNEGNSYSFYPPYFDQYYYPNQEFLPNPALYHNFPQMYSDWNAPSPQFPNVSPPFGSMGANVNMGRGGGPVPFRGRGSPTSNFGSFSGTTRPINRRGRNRVRGYQTFNDRPFDPGFASGEKRKENEEMMSYSRREGQEVTTVYRQEGTKDEQVDDFGRDIARRMSSTSRPMSRNETSIPKSPSHYSDLDRRRDGSRGESKEKRSRERSSHRSSRHSHPHSHHSARRSPNRHGRLPNDRRRSRSRSHSRRRSPNYNPDQYHKDDRRQRISDNQESYYNMRLDSDLLVPSDVVEKQDNSNKSRRSRSASPRMQMDDRVPQIDNDDRRDSPIQIEEELDDNQRRARSSTPRPLTGMSIEHESKEEIERKVETVVNLRESQSPEEDVSSVRGENETPYHGEDITNDDYEDREIDSQYRSSEFDHPIKNKNSPNYHRTHNSRRSERHRSSHHGGHSSSEHEEYHSQSRHGILSKDRHEEHISSGRHYDDPHRSSHARHHSIEREERHSQSRHKDLSRHRHEEHVSTSRRYEESHRLSHHRHASSEQEDRPSQSKHGHTSSKHRHEERSSREHRNSIHRDAHTSLRHSHETRAASRDHVGHRASSRHRDGHTSSSRDHREARNSRSKRSSSKHRQSKSRHERHSSVERDGKKRRNYRSTSRDVDDYSRKRSRI